MIVAAGRRFGDPGFYFTVHDHRGHIRARYVRAVQERISVFPAEAAAVRADHVLTLWGATFLRLHYRLRTTAPAAGVLVSNSRGAAADGGSCVGRAPGERPARSAPSACRRAIPAAEPRRQPDHGTHMKLQILRAVAGARLAAVVPPPLRRRLPGALRTGGPYTVVLFPMSVDPVRSGGAARAVARLGPPDEGAEPIVALGAGFTAEAHAILVERGATVVTVSDFHWTDASYERIRSSVASPRKSRGGLA